MKQVVLTMNDKSEKYLKSIDNTLKAILKELNKSNRHRSVQLNGREISNALASHEKTTTRGL